MRHAISLGTAVRPRRNAGYPEELEAKYEIQLLPFLLRDFLRKNFKSVFSLFQRQLFLWNALFSLLLHGGVIRHLFFFLFNFFLILKTCRRKEMAPLFHFTWKHSAPQSSIWNIFTYFRTGIAGQQNGGFSGVFYVFLLRSSQVRISVGSVVFKSENQKRVKKSSKKRNAIVNINSWIIIIRFCINGNWMLYIQP